MGHGTPVLLLNQPGVHDIDGVIWNFYKEPNTASMGYYPAVLWKTKITHHVPVTIVLAHSEPLLHQLRAFLLDKGVPNISKAPDSQTRHYSAHFGLGKLLVIISNTSVKEGKKNYRAKLSHHGTAQTTI